MSDPRTPRPSNGWNAARGPQPGSPDAAGRTPPSVDPLESLLEGYARSTDIAPAPDLSRRIHAAISREPARTPPRRFLVALLGFRLSAARDAFAQTAGVAVGRGRFPALVRAQAMALMILTLGVVSVGAVGGAVGLRALVDGLDLDPSPVQLVASPSPSLAPTPSASPSVSPSPSPSVAPSPSPSAVPSPSPEPSEEATDDPTAEPTEAVTVQVRRTPPPDGGTKATPRPTQRPRATPKPTPKATREPKETEKPRRTPKPTKKPTPVPEPTDDDDDDEPDETDEPDEPDDDKDDDDSSGSGGKSGPGSAGQARSGAVVTAGPVRLVITF